MEVPRCLIPEFKSEKLNHWHPYGRNALSIKQSAGTMSLIRTIGKEIDNLAMRMMNRMDIPSTNTHR